MELKKRLLLLIMPFLLFSAAADEPLRGKPLADSIYNDLSRNGINSRKITLFRSEEDNFPYNIQLNVKTLEKEPSIEERQYTAILLVFSQEEIAQRMQFLYNLIETVKKSGLEYNVSVLLSSGDIQEISGNETMTGTEIYCEFIEGTENMCAIPVNFSTRKLCSLSAGSDFHLSPLWLLRIITESLEENEMTPVINGGMFISLYKLGLLSSSRKLSAFLSRDIPAVELNLPASFSDFEKLNRVFSRLLEKFENQEKFNNDVHYIPIKLAGYYYWINEHVTIALLILTIIACLLIIADLGFIFRKKHSQKNLMTKRALRSMYLIPGTIIASTLFLELGQFIAGLFYKTTFQNLLILFGIKLVFSVVLIYISYLAELKFHERATDYSYSYLVSISSFMNIFIFSAIDITLFYLFAVIYIIFVLSILFKKNISIYIFFVLSILPYFQLIFESMMYSSNRQILPFILSKPIYNILLSCALTPVYLTILRIISNLNTSGKKMRSSAVEKVKTKFPKYYVLFQIGTVAFFAAAIFFLSLLIRKRFSVRYDNFRMPGQIVESNTNNLLSVSYKDINYYGGTIRRLSIDTKKPAVRVDIIVSGQSDNPVYYTINQYLQAEKFHHIQFIIPDYPPEKFSVSYTPDNSNISIIEVYAYYSHDDYPAELLNLPSNFRTRRKIFYKEKAVKAIDMPYSGESR